VQEEQEGTVETFAMNYAQEILRCTYKTLEVVENQKYGYDLLAEKDDGTWHYIEVKGRKGEPDIELTRNETEAADDHREEFYLCVIAQIPEHPDLYMVQNPVDVGEKEKLTVRSTVWKRYPLKG
jgi:hypothetical protein